MKHWIRASVQSHISSDSQSVKMDLIKRNYIPHNFKMYSLLIEQQNIFFLSQVFISQNGSIILLFVKTSTLLFMVVKYETTFSRILKVKSKILTPHKYHPKFLVKQSNN